MAEPVIGANDLRRAFLRAGSNLDENMRDRLKYFARPVERDAELLAQANGVGPQWSRMRIGSSRSEPENMVYVAPEMRGTRIRYRKRREFAGFLIGRAMEPALDRHRDQITKDIDKLLARLERDWERG